MAKTPARSSTRGQTQAGPAVRHFRSLHRPGGPLETCTSARPARGARTSGVSDGRHVRCGIQGQAALDRRHQLDLGDRRGLLVMFMQAGFAFLEIGFSRGKNAGTVIAKILTNFSIAGSATGRCGFAFAFGAGDRSSGTHGLLPARLRRPADGVPDHGPRPTRRSRRSGSSSSSSARSRWRSSGARRSSASSSASTSSTRSSSRR